MTLLRRLRRRLFPPRCCGTCKWSQETRLTTLDCIFGCGKGCARPVWRDEVCQHRKRRVDRNEINQVADAIRWKYINESIAIASRRKAEEGDLS
jgi:hypothetical protein